ncbi:MAG: hypothetical protein Q7T80_14105 [Methanoregula sp.]|nr:hypothetical protein [Methanoregula sp.]
MKLRVLILLALLIAGVMVAGCTQSPAVPVAVPTPTAAVAAPAVTATSVQQPSFTLGQAYLNDPGGYQLLTEKDTVVKEFRVDSDTWGVYFKILPLNENLEYCWFTMDVIDVNTNKSAIDSTGYGRSHSLEKEQWIPMYKQGPYKLIMKGNNVKVWVTAGKRNP